MISPSSSSNASSSSSFWITCGILLTTSTVAAYYMSSTGDKKGHAQRPSVSVAFLGNSMQYFNDCPRLVQCMLQAAGYNATQDSCLRGGATLSSLWTKGNGMQQKFATPPAQKNNKRESRHRSASFDIGAPTVQALLARPCWDFVVLQDHTQVPARAESRQESIKALQKQYRPLMTQSPAPPRVLLLQTHAYRVPGLKESADLGNFHQFTDALAEGYQAYAQALSSSSSPANGRPPLQVQIIPMGRAVQWLYTHRRFDLWECLYSWDDFHPSPHGTWLQACLIFLAVTDGRPPPVYHALWWDACRYMQPPSEKPLPLPTARQAEDLRQLAMMIHDHYHRHDITQPARLVLHHPGMIRSSSTEELRDTPLPPLEGAPEL